MTSKDKKILKETVVLGGDFDRNNYKGIVWAPSRDGKRFQYR